LAAVLQSSICQKPSIPLLIREYVCLNAFDLIAVVFCGGILSLRMAF
jgi:hypothetical protein